MNKNQEKIKAALSRIDDCLATINTDKDWLQYLCFQSKFYNYSFSNAMLIFSQNPEASYVKGYKAWNQLGRYVKRGSKGLAILAPCFKKTEVFKEPENKSEYQDAEGEKETRKVISGFRVTYVFDIADTDGSDEYLPVLVKGLAGNSDAEKEIYERLFAFISTEHTVKEVAGTASKGSYDASTGKWNIGDLAIGESVRLDILCLILATGEITNNANVTCNENETDLDNNHDNATCIVKDIPNNETENVTNHTEHAPAHTQAALKETGNPVAYLLFALLAIFASCWSRKEQG